MPPASSSPAKRPQRIRMEGQSIHLVPLDPAKHTADLYQLSHGPEADSLWQYLFDGPYPSESEFHAALMKKAATEDPLFYAIVDINDNHTERAIGFASLMRIEPLHRCIEVGSILYTPALQRTRGATEAMYLLARYIFEDLGYRRYEWKCNALNEPSRIAAHRLGFTYEGLFRQHMIVKGRSRDTAWFSMLDTEWPARKAAFERWLHPDNFDAQGRQRLSLSQWNA